MRTRALFMFCGIALIAISIAIVGTGYLLARSYGKVELSLARDKAEQVERALDMDLRQLDLSARKYAEADDATDFVLGRSRMLLDRGMDYRALETIQVDFVWIASKTGVELLSVAVDEARQEVTSPANIDLRAIFGPHLASVAQIRARPARERLLATPAGLVVFSVAEIARPNQLLSPDAVLFMGRILNIDELERMRGLLQTPIELMHLTGAARPALMPPLSNWATRATHANRYFVEPQGRGQINSHVALFDIEGRPVGLLSIARRSEIFLLGWRTTWLLLGVLLILISAAIVGMAALFGRLQRSALAHAAVQRRYTNVVSHLKDTLLLAERHSGRIVEANEALAQALGYEMDEIKRLTLGQIYADLHSVVGVDQQAPNVHECRMRAKGGKLIDVEVTVTRLQDAGDELICVLGRDITARKQAEQQAIENRRKLSRLANHDSLTGLPNRLFLQTRLPRLLRKLAHSERLLAVFYVDVDNFKNVNDSRGHGSGDQLLRIFAKRLKAATGAHDIVVRMGGDEFVIVASLLPDLKAVESIARRLVATAQAPIVLEETALNVSASIGVSVYPNDGIDAESLLKHADIALYQAKEGGRNTFKIFTSSMDVDLNEQVALEQALRHAIGTPQLFVEYQPVINLQTGRLESFEALLRWQHPEIGYVPPVRFIPIAEKTGLIVDLGDQVLRIVCAQLREWADENVPLAPVAINVSALQLQRVQISTRVHELTYEFDIDPQLLHFEITESAMVQKSQELFVTLQTLRELGSKVSIDDFGTGFSNLSYLKHMPIDALKIDQAFVRDVVADHSDAAIVSGVVSMAKQLRLRTVAEGIETQEQYERLRELGCLYGQGYFFSKPIAAPHCRALLEQLGTERKFTETAKLRAFARR